MLEAPIVLHNNEATYSGQNFPSGDSPRSFHAVHKVRYDYSLKLVLLPIQCHVFLFS